MVSDNWYTGTSLPFLFSVAEHTYSLLVTIKWCISLLLKPSLFFVLMHPLPIINPLTSRNFTVERCNLLGLIAVAKLAAIVCSVQFSEIRFMAGRRKYFQ